MVLVNFPNYIPNHPQNKTAQYHNKYTYFHFIPTFQTISTKSYWTSSYFKNKTYFLFTPINWHYWNYKRKYKRKKKKWTTTTMLMASFRRAFLSMRLFVRLVGVTHAIAVQWIVHWLVGPFKPDRQIHVRSTMPRSLRMKIDPQAPGPNRSRSQNNAD